MKFMARYAEAAGMRRNQASISRRPANVIQSALRKAMKITAAKKPRVRPLREKARPGSHGSDKGVKTAPARIAVRSAKTESMP